MAGQFDITHQFPAQFIAQAKAALGGDLGRIKRCVRLGGFINATPHFAALPAIMNGASDFMVEVLGDARRLGLDIGDAQVLDRYEKWRALDSIMVMGATDSLTRLFGVPGKAASAVRRLGMAGVQRSGWLKKFFMDEARGVSGDVPELMKA